MRGRFVNIISHLQKSAPVTKHALFLMIQKGGRTLGLHRFSRLVHGVSIAFFCPGRQQSNRDQTRFGLVVTPRFGVPRRVVIGEGR